MSKFFPDTKIADFDYDLPRAQIAQTPAEPRDSARLMVIDKHAGQMRHQYFRDLPQFLSANDVLVFNQTKVEPRRLFAHKEATGGRVEVLLMEPDSSAGQQGQSRWLCKVRPGIKPGQKLVFLDRAEKPGALAGTVEEITPSGERWIAFNQKPEAVWEEYGALPIPPYIQEYTGDESFYQTIYAKEGGSVAAPTAGRHFTQGLFDQLEEMGVGCEYLTLHVARDTAFPILTVEKAEEVELHSEVVSLSAKTAETITQAKQAGKRIIAVGTTSVRSLEGVAARQLASGSEELLAEYNGPVDLFIRPGHAFSVVDGMITNFHFPRSSLMLLVGAMLGQEKLMAAYQEAVRQDYRFLSFGDAMLIA